MDYAPTLTFARSQDQKDPLGGYQAKFFLPTGLARDGKTVTYLVGNSLGLQPRAATDFVEDELDRWARFGKEGYFLGDDRWVDAPQRMAPSYAKLLGCRAEEVIPMGTLSANLHLLLGSFYKPEGRRNVILMEGGAFPSDRFVVESHVRLHGLDPAECIVYVEPEDGRYLLTTDQLTETIGGLGEELALVMLPGVQYFTGQYLDLETITRAAHAVDAVMGVDLAHAIGNVTMQLHDWGVDFGAWCGYKYLCGGPGAPGGVYVHERHGGDRPRLAGWWGQDPDARFEMDQPFRPAPGAAGYQVSCAEILAMAPLRASLELFDDAGIQHLRKRSRQLTGYLEFMIRRADPDAELLEVITPEDPKWRGAQLSVAIHGELGKAVYEALKTASVICDWRGGPREGDPGVIRMTPHPLYNTFIDVLRAGETLRVVLAAAQKRAG